MTCHAVVAQSQDKAGFSFILLLFSFIYIHAFQAVQEIQYSADMIVFPFLCQITGTGIVGSLANVS